MSGRPHDENVDSSGGAIVKTAADPLSAAATLGEALRERVRVSGPRKWLTLFAKDRVDCTLTFGDLLAGAEAWASELIRFGVAAGERVLLVLPTDRSFYESYWGVILAGGVPVPAYPPVRLGRMEEYLRTLAGLIANSGAVVLITNKQLRPLVHPVVGMIDHELGLVVPEDVRAAPGVSAIPVAAGDLGLLQYTSGSTGNQKGVMLTHANLLANLRAIGAAVRLTPEDTAVSWLPLYHDMGLIGLMLGSLYWGLPLVAMSPIDFLRRPARWIRALSEHKATVSAAPNFAYSLAARKIRQVDLEGIDLSDWRLALCGAEPIHPATVETFTRRFEPCGFRPEAFFPAYGLAENTLAVSFSELGTPPHLEHVDAGRLESEGRAVRVGPGETARTFVSVGKPLKTVEVEVVDDNGQAVGEGVRGEVTVRGPSVMAGYFKNPEATAQVLRDGSCRTGDLGFFLDARLYICGRRKDMVIKAGRNYFAEDLEAAAATVPGVRPGGLCVFAVENRARGTEEVVLVAESADDAERQGLSRALTKAVSEATGCRPDRVELVPPRTLPKTSSGKIQRFKACAWYQDGSLSSRGGEIRISGVWVYLRAWIREKLGLVRR
jgi:acyl-CoA synthetase (AMP-forming)/AMP-acid ligase II